MRKSILFYTFSILFILSSFTFAEENVYPLYRLTKEPVLDGVVRNDPAWKNIPVERGFIELGTSSSTLKQTYFKIGYTPKALYKRPTREKTIIL